MTEQAKILIVDDEGSIRYFLSEELSQAGYITLTAASGEEALVQLEKEAVDLVLLDLKMGGMSGLQVMERIEKQPLSPAVIILTAYGTLDSAVGAMRLGGCDYLTKPCGIEELLDSVERGLAKRREAMQRQKMIHLIEETARQLQASPSLAGKPMRQPRFLEERGFLLDREQETVTWSGETMSLTATEFRLLALLMEYPDQTISYRELASALHGSSVGEWEEQDARQTLSTHLWRLRRKLGQDSKGNPYVINIRGRGYKFVSNA
ncbi:MAG: response regulator transcription factor [Chloroflexi bacterium]|nr:response regulator transcription factor [Chloroflexota bacterium]